jgi:hypothetical protein
MLVLSIYSDLQRLLRSVLPIAVGSSCLLWRARYQWIHETSSHWRVALLPAEQHGQVNVLVGFGVLIDKTIFIKA